MSALGFDLLDRHVVDGRGDDIACTDDGGSLTYARLLEQAAALGGGLGVLGVSPGDEVAVAVPQGNQQVVIVCACVRIGAVPGGRGEVRIDHVDGTVTVHMDDRDIDLSVIAKAGAADPAPARAEDPPGYQDKVRNGFDAVIDALLAGTPIA